MAKRRDKKGKQQVAKASGRTVELAVQRALAELDFAPGELADDQYEVTIVIPPEEGFMGVGAVDAVVEVALVGEEFDFYGPEDDTQPAELLQGRVEDENTMRTTSWKTMRSELGRLRATRKTRDRGQCQRLRNFGRSWKGVEGDGPSGASAYHEMPGGAARRDHRGGSRHPHRRRGQTIDAVEYLAGIAVFPGSTLASTLRSTLKGTRSGGRRQIERVAMRKADEAAKRGRPVQLTPMTPAERKIVHLALRGRDDVVTASQGREPNRSVVISPVR